MVTVRDTAGATATASVRIDVGNTPPVPRILSPRPETKFRVGQAIALIGVATDLQDGLLDPSRLSWKVTLHHGNHTHPYLPPTTGNGIVFRTPPPEDLAATTNSYLTIELTATDSQGLTATVSQTLQPRLVGLLFTTEPGGLRLDVNDSVIITPRLLLSWEGFVLTVQAPSQFDAAGRWLELDFWSDGGAAEHDIVTPPSGSLYTAAFRPAVNLALNRPIVATSAEGPHATAERAVDGDLATRWIAADSAPQVLVLTLDQLTRIERIVLHWSEDAFATIYGLWVSEDGNTWTPIHATVGGDGDVDDLSWLSTDGRYILLLATMPGPLGGYSLREFEVYGRPGDDAAH